MDSTKPDAELILNEADYKFVFDRLENQLKVAPNIVYDRDLEKYLTDLSCEIVENYCSKIRIYVIDQPDFNAHMLPNGALIVYTGLLLRINKRAQLAYILAHEIAHYVYKHGVKKINYAKITNQPQINVNKNKPLFDFDRSASAIMQNKYSQKLEHEADVFSIKALTDENYSLTHAATWFKNLNEENTALNKVNRGGYLSSHPGTRQRIKFIKAHSNKVLVKVADKKNSWMTIKNKFINEWLSAQLRKREFKSTKVLLDQLQSSSTNPGYYSFYVGEIFRKQGGVRNLKYAIKHYLNHLDSSNAKPLASVYKSLAQAYSGIAQFNQAKLYYQKYLNLNPKPEDIDLIRQEFTSLPL